MSEDKLKQFIDDNRSAFELEGPSEGLWDSIDEKLKAKAKESGAPVIPAAQSSQKSRWKVWAMAASLALIVGLGATLFLQNRSGQNTKLIAHEVSETDLAQFNEELAEIDNYYSVQVNKRVKSLEAYAPDEELMLELTELSNEYDTLRKEMGLGFDDSQIVAAMIENYRLRLDLLEDLLEAMEQAEGKKSKRSNHEF